MASLVVGDAVLIVISRDTFAKVDIVNIGHADYYLGSDILDEYLVIRNSVVSQSSFLGCLEVSLHY